MALDPDILILNSISTANTFLGKADAAIQDIKSNSFTQYGFLPSPDISNFDVAPYVPPPKDLSPAPVYEPPTAPFPDKPDLADTTTLNLPVMPEPPEYTVDGLFNQVAPTTNIPDWNNAEPDLRIDSLVAEMDRIAQPILRELEFPVLAPLHIGPAPTLNLPAYTAPLPPDTLRDPADYQAVFESRYHALLPEMQSYIDDKVACWITAYAPEYDSQRRLVAEKLEAVLSGGQALPDQFEAALYSRARGRVEQEFASVEAGLVDSFSKRGFIAPPGALTAGLHAGRLKGADALANQATDIYIKRREMEVQHLQFVLNLSSAQIQSVRGLALQYAGVVLNTIQQAVSYAAQCGDMAIKLYDHLIARSNLIIQVMAALNTQYETRLKAALSGLEGYKLQLEAEKLKKDVELADVTIIAEQIKSQEVQVSLYNALIEAIGRKASLEELKLKGYQTRADVFKTQIEAQVAGFEVYNASLKGDLAKLDFELAKLKNYEAQLQAFKTQLEANVKIVDFTVASNDAKVKLFQSEGDVYKLDAQSSVQKFTALAEVKKLAQSIYQVELQGSVEIYRALLEQPKLMIEAALREYDGRIRSFETTGRLNIEELRRVQSASIALAEGFSGIAQSALGGINSMISSVKTTSG